MFGSCGGGKQQNTEADADTVDVETLVPRDYNTYGLAVLAVRQNEHREMVTDNGDT